MSMCVCACKGVPLHVRVCAHVHVCACVRVCARVCPFMCVFV